MKTIILYTLTKRDWRFTYNQHNALIGILKRKDNNTILNMFVDLFDDLKYATLKKYLTLDNCALILDALITKTEFQLILKPDLFTPDENEEEKIIFEKKAVEKAVKNALATAKAKARKKAKLKAILESEKQARKASKQEKQATNDK